MDKRNLLIVFCILATIAVASLIMGRRGEPATAIAGPVVLSSGAGDGGTDTVFAEVPEQVREFLANGQSWRAARSMRDYLDGEADAEPDAVLLAARAEAGWGGWPAVREYLEGRDWLGEVSDGEGWYWLGRALEEDEDWDAAATAYGEYLSMSPDEAAGAAADRRLVAELRRGLIMLRRGGDGAGAAQGADALANIRERVPVLAPWVDILAAESLAETGDVARVRELVAGIDRSELRLRGRRAILAVHRNAGDPAAVRQAAREFRGQASGDAERAEFALAAARASIDFGETAAARADLRVAIAAPGTSSARAAAGLLEEAGGLTDADRLAIAAVLDRHAGDARAAQLYDAWLASGSGGAADRARVRMDMAQALFDSGDFDAAIDAATPLADAGGGTGASALYLIGRARYRGGDSDAAFATWDRLADRHPGTALGSEGLFLIGDLSHDEGETEAAARAYRRLASNFRGTDRAGLSLMRLAGMAYQAERWSDARDTWNEYRSTYSRGQRWLEASYWAARSHEQLGDPNAASAIYRQIIDREPISYYALLASRRLGAEFWPIPLAASPPVDDAARAAIEEWMRGVDLLSAAGLHDEAELEADRAIDRAGSDNALLYPLAEALIDRGLTVRGIRIGIRLDNAASRPNERLLRILYPFPYRSLIEAEAREKGLDPFLVASLSRQESLFKARITSPVGARGLMQIMPETGRVLARSADIPDWDAELLYQPEINAHLGTNYLAEQMERYDETLPAVFSAYNAGPHRIDRWMKIFPEWGDDLLFTERIPYRETRDYVKILTRNIAVYRGLYGAIGEDGVAP